MQERFIDTLKSAGVSITKPRRMVFIFLQNKEPLTMNQLCLALSGELNRASLYRTIALFERLGIVRRLQIGWKYKIELSDRFAHHHHHLTCLGCGIVIPIKEDQGLEQQLADILKPYKFTQSSHELEVRGYCQLCSNKKTPDIV